MHSRLHYTRAGSGEPLVLIHGIGHRGAAWNPVFERLAEHHDVIAVDLAGFGASPAYPDGTRYSMENAIENLVANFEEWGVSRPHVVGNSLGGAIALELGASGHARSVTALSPAGFFGIFNRLQAVVTLVVLRILALVTPDAVLRAFSRSRLGQWALGFLLYQNPTRIPPDDHVGDALALKRCRAFERTIKEGAHYRFDSIVPVPVTIAWATRDKVLPYTQAGLAQERLPFADHVPLPHCGHVPMVDAPDLVVQHIENTIARTRESAPRSAAA